MMMPTDTSLRFAANLKWMFADIPFEQRFDAAATAGFQGVEYPSPYDYSAAQVRTWLDNTGLEQVLINTPQGPTGSATAAGLACLPGLGDQFRQGIDRGLEYAHTLGCRLLHVVAGIRPESVSRDRAFAQYVANLAWAVDRARGSGVQLVLEAQNKRNAPGFLLESQAQVASVVEALGSESVGVLFDVFHTQVDEGDVTRTLEQVAPLVSHIQIADAPDRTQPGTGELAWPYVLRRIRDVGYDGWIGCEFTPSDDPSIVLKSLKEMTA